MRLPLLKPLTVVAFVVMTVRSGDGRLRRERRNQQKEIIQRQHHVAAATGLTPPKAEDTDDFKRVLHLLDASVVVTESRTTTTVPPTTGLPSSSPEEATPTLSPSFLLEDFPTEGPSVPTSDPTVGTTNIPTSIPSSGPTSVSTSGLRECCEQTVRAISDFGLELFESALFADSIWGGPSSCTNDISDCILDSQPCCGVQNPSILHCDCEEQRCIVTDPCAPPGCAFRCPDSRYDLNCYAIPCLCRRKDCGFQCPIFEPMGGEPCDSKQFEGWQVLDRENNLQEGSCIYNEEECSCPGSPPRDGMSCKCVGDIWQCNQHVCENCAQPTISPTAMPSNSPTASSSVGSTDSPPAGATLKPSASPSIDPTFDPPSASPSTIDPIVMTGRPSFGPSMSSVSTDGPTERPTELSTTVAPAPPVQTESPTTFQRSIPGCPGQVVGVFGDIGLGAVEGCLFSGLSTDAVECYNGQFACVLDSQTCCGVRNPMILQCNCETEGCFATDMCAAPGCSTRCPSRRCTGIRGNCNLVDCSFQCPMTKPSTGEPCDSTKFEGWQIFDEELNDVHEGGECIYEEESSCRCRKDDVGEDKWECANK